MNVPRAVCNLQMLTILSDDVNATDESVLNGCDRQPGAECHGQNTSKRPGSTRMHPERTMRSCLYQGAAM